jgi:hypothetical protein
MNVNPYQSPRLEESYKEPLLGESGTVLRLLSEIRDAQSESLELQREAMRMQKRATAFFSLRMIFPLIIFAVALFYMLSRTVFLPPAPARALPRAVPSVAPKSAPLPR